MLDKQSSSCNLLETRNGAIDACEGPATKGLRPDFDIDWIWSKSPAEQGTFPCAISYLLQAGSDGCREAYQKHITQVRVPIRVLTLADSYLDAQGAAP